MPRRGAMPNGFALVATTATFMVSLFIFGSLIRRYELSDGGRGDWLMGLKYKLGVDGISVLFVMLTTFMMPLVIAASWGRDHSASKNI